MANDVDVAPCEVTTRAPRIVSQGTIRLRPIGARRWSRVAITLAMLAAMLSLASESRTSFASLPRTHASLSTLSSRRTLAVVPHTHDASLTSRTKTVLAGKATSGPVVINQSLRSPRVRLRQPVRYPVGVLDAAQPSGRAPPTNTAMSGYRLTYENGFTGTSLPSGWLPYSGVPGGDAGGQFAPTHVVVSDGMLQLNTWQDPSFNNEWVTGGLCQCGVARTYGAYFVRSRVTGAGPTAVELLWPVARVWPPEIDFSETGGTTTASSATLHFSSPTQFVQSKLSIDMTQWHTWGVIWTPTSVVYTVDGKTWGVVNTTADIPRQPMTLDIQQQTWCASGWACPTQPESLQVDWVAEYAPA